MATKIYPAAVAEDAQPMSPDMFSFIFASNVERTTFYYGDVRETYRGQVPSQASLDHLVEMQESGMCIYGRLGVSPLCIRLRLEKEDA